MALIEINHKTLRDVASAITTYCSAQDREMRSADAEVKSMLATDWTGQDAQEFGAKWEAVDEADSTTVRFKKNMENFGNCLVACADEYQKAQAEAFNMANSLPKFIAW